MERQFLMIEQGDRIIREYDAEFARLRGYIHYGFNDGAAIIQRFQHGLQPRINGRLQGVTYISYNN